MTAPSRVYKFAACPCAAECGSFVELLQIDGCGDAWPTGHKFASLDDALAHVSKMNWHLSMMAQRRTRKR